MRPHIHLSKEQIVPHVITCGDPARAELFSTLLDSPKILARNREYHSFLGQKNGKPLLIISHGVGAAGATICFRELIDLGVNTIVRIGTAGGLREDTKIGDVMIPTAAIRQEGVTPLMVPLEYPAIPDFDLTANLLQEFRKSDLRPWTGVVLSTDLFYDGPLGNQFAFFQKVNCQAVEMECSALFILGQLYKVQTAAVLGLDGNPLKWEENVYNPQSTKLKDSLLQSAEKVMEVLSRLPY